MTQSSINKNLIPSVHVLLLGIWGHLSQRRRLQLILLLILVLASGGAELVSLGAVLPFLMAISEPELLWQQPLVQSLLFHVGITNANQLLIPVTLIFASAAVVAGLIRLLNLWCNGRLAAAIGSDLSCDAYRRTLYQPYQVHVRRSSASVINGTTSQIGITVAGLNALLQTITSAVVAATLLIGLLLIDPSVAVGAVGLFGTVYGVLAITARRQLRSNSQKIAEASTQQIKALQEGLGAIRDVLLDGSQPVYLNIYRQADHPQRQLAAKNAFLATFPRFAIEALGMVGIALIGALLVSHQHSSGSSIGVISLLGAFALGAQRLLPALQQVYSGWSSLKAYSAAMKGVLDMLSQPLPPKVTWAQPLPLLNNICLENVCFSYGPEQENVLEGLDLQFQCGERIGLIGATGSGKSTTIDLIMGLLAPTTGKVLIDGVDLHDPLHPDRLFAWRSAIAHVPQSIYLADSTVAENIAFGVPAEQIDLKRVKNAAKQAQISSFIESTPNAYQEFVGERGVRLSGGQRQRIGIARALYKQASVLVFDEATSALDTDTEDAVMSAVDGLDKELTIVMVAHRLSTLQRCDRIVRLVNGRVESDGPPRSLL